MKPSPEQLEFATTSLLMALSARDLETGGHAKRVQDLALNLGRALQLDQEALYALKFGAALHDLGKLNTPDLVLRKPTRLNELEWETMRRHPLDGAHMLRALNFPETTCLVLEQHHERFDGQGYPFKLCGNEISLPARVFAVADTFDAITSNRCYRPGNSKEVAFHEIASYSNTQFDPNVVNALLNLPSQLLPLPHQAAA